MEQLIRAWEASGIYLLFERWDYDGIEALGPLLMIGVGVLLLYLAIKRNFEPRREPRR